MDALLLGSLQGMWGDSIHRSSEHKVPHKSLGPYQLLLPKIMGFFKHKSKRKSIGIEGNMSRGPWQLKDILIPCRLKNTCDKGIQDATCLGDSGELIVKTIC